MRNGGSRNASQFRRGCLVIAIWVCSQRGGLISPAIAWASKPLYYANMRAELYFRSETEMPLCSQTFPTGEFSAKDGLNCYLKA